MKRWTKKAGIVGSRSFHGLRKRGATAIIDNDGSEATAQQFLNHMTPAETQDYVKEKDARKRASAAIELLSFERKKKEVA